VSGNYGYSKSVKGLEDLICISYPACLGKRCMIRTVYTQNGSSAGDEREGVDISIAMNNETDTGLRSWGRLPISLRESISSKKFLIPRPLPARIWVTEPPPGLGVMVMMVFSSSCLTSSEWARALRRRAICTVFASA
jgi:hypothetical protein